MEFPGFQTHALSLACLGDEALEVVYLDNHARTDGPCLLLLHGLFDNKATWARLGERLGDFCRIIVPDLVGFGRSSKPVLDAQPESYRYSVAMHVDCLVELIIRLDLGELVLGGNSLGGGLALRLYLSRPDVAARTCGLVLVDAAAYPQELPGYVRQLGGWLGTLLNNPLLRLLLFRCRLVEYQVRQTFRRAFHDAGKIPEELVAEAVAVLGTPNVFRAYQLAARNLIPPDHESLVARFREVDCPTLILWGEEDRIVPPLHVLRFKEDIPHALCHTFPQCGHAPHLEYTGETAALIRRWMQERLRSAGK